MSWLWTSFDCSVFRNLFLSSDFSEFSHSVIGLLGGMCVCQDNSQFKKQSTEQSNMELHCLWHSGHELVRHTSIFNFFYFYFWGVSHSAQRVWRLLLLGVRIWCLSYLYTAAWTWQNWQSPASHPVLLKVSRVTSHCPQRPFSAWDWTWIWGFVHARHLPLLPGLPLNRYVKDLHDSV